MPPKKVTCKWCGREFLRPRTQSGYRRYCSGECRAKAVEKRERESYLKTLAKKRAENAPKLIVRCAVCGKEFHSPRGTARYCSVACKQAQNAARILRIRERQREFLSQAEECDRERLWMAFAHRRATPKDYGIERFIGVSKAGMDDIGEAIFA